jgi:hypothetical protein
MGHPANVVCGLKPVRINRVIHSLNFALNAKSVKMEEL